MRRPSATCRGSAPTTENDDEGSRIDTSGATPSSAQPTPPRTDPSTTPTRATRREPRPLPRTGTGATAPTRCPTAVLFMGPSRAEGNGAERDGTEERDARQRGSRKLAPGDRVCQRSRGLTGRVGEGRSAEQDGGGRRGGILTYELWPLRRSVPRRSVMLRSAP